MDLDNESLEFVFLREKPEKADVAIVFGSNDMEELTIRIQRAVTLYQAGFLPRLVLTGGPAADSEAKRMAKIAERLGVPHNDLILEDRSRNTFENARFSREVLRSLGLLECLQTDLLISSEWHMRRILWTAKAKFPPEIRFLCCPCLEGCTKENWTLTEECQAAVPREFMILKRFLGAGLFPSAHGE